MNFEPALFCLGRISEIDSNFKHHMERKRGGTCTSLCLNFQALRQQLHDLREEAFTESKEADLGWLGTGRDSRTFQFDH